MEERYTKEYIARLLNRFMEGATTIEEERLLADYFRKTEHVTEEWSDYRRMFDWFSEGMPMKKTAPRRRWWPWAAAAAVITAIIIAFSIPGKETPQVAQQTAPSAPSAPVIKTQIQPEPSVEPTKKLAIHKPKQKKTSPKKEKVTEEPQLAANLNPAVVQRLLEEDALYEAVRHEQMTQLVNFDAQMQAQGYQRLLLDDGNIVYTQQTIYVEQ
ncbi:MAG: hypothetical protein IJL29_06945 [Prevotella sp.]|nr:hypothetical protein [Prevotella sp.]MBQ6308806.1 hypothetical protein [Prevotella sp.]MBQ9570963.1 hypothetical protein [Prevotella sp.]